MGNLLPNLPPVSEAPSLRELKRRATSRHLAAAAYELAREVGLDAFTIDDVAARAGYARRTFANHFSCKQEAVVDGFFAHLGLPLALDEVGTAGLTGVGDVIDLSERVVAGMFTPERLGEIHAFGRLVEDSAPVRPYVLDGLHRLRSSGRLADLSELVSDETQMLLFGATLGIVATVLETVMRQADCAADAAPQDLDLTATAATLQRAFDLLRHGFLGEGAVPR